MADDCSRALFGGPFVIATDADLGQCDIALFGGPLVVYVTDTVQDVTAISTGGAIVGGTASVVATVVIEADAGGITGGTGTCEVIIIGIYEAIGGALVGGVVTGLYQLKVDASNGGSIAGGAAALVAVRIETSMSGAEAGAPDVAAECGFYFYPSGGAEAGGACADLLFTVIYTYSAIGGGVTAGLSEINVLKDQLGLGGAVSGCTTDYVKIIAHYSSEGAVAGGNTAYAYVRSYESDAGGVSNGYGMWNWTEYLGDDEQLSYDNIRQIISVKNNGVSLRIKLQGSSVAPVTIDGAGWGRRSGSTGNYDVTPVRLTFNGGDYGVTIPAGEFVYTDWVTTTIDKSYQYLFHLALADADSWMKVSTKGRLKEYYKLLGIDDTLTKVIVDYSTSTRATAVVAVEVSSYQHRENVAIGGGEVAGDATVESVAAISGSAGAVVGGTAPCLTVLADSTQTQAEESFGGVVASGGVTTEQVVVLATSEGAVTGGSVTPWWVTAIAVDYGGAVAGDSAELLYSFEFSILGGALAGGAGEIDLSNMAYAAQGGGLAGGIGAKEFLYIIYANGGAVVGGEHDAVFLRASGQIHCNYFPINQAPAGPWPFVEQPDVWGYINNPRWRKIG